MQIWIQHFPEYESNTSPGSMWGNNQPRFCEMLYFYTSVLPPFWQKGQTKASCFFFFPTKVQTSLDGNSTYFIIYFSFYQRKKKYITSYKSQVFCWPGSTSAVNTFSSPAPQVKCSSCMQWLSSMSSFHTGYLFVRLPACFVTCPGIGNTQPYAFGPSVTLFILSSTWFPSYIWISDVFEMHSPHTRASARTGASLFSCQSSVTPQPASYQSWTGIHQLLVVQGSCGLPG